MVSETIKAIHEVELEADKIIADGKASELELIERTKSESSSQCEQEISRAKSESDERIKAAQQEAEEHRQEALKGLESELEELREDAKRKEKDAIQKIIDAVVS